MSKERYLNTKFWDDNYIIEKDPIEKLLFLYLLTNALTNIIGIYEISTNRIAFDTGIDKDMVIKILERFEADDRAKYENGWIALKNFTKHQKNNPKINKGIEILTNEVPLKLLRWVNIDKKRFNISMEIVEIVDNSTKIVDNSLKKTKKSKNIDYDRLSHPNTNPNTNLNKEYKDIKESGDSFSDRSKIKDKDPLEFSFENKCWWGLYDWRIKMYQGAFPMLTVNYLFNDLWKKKFLADPDKYKRMIKEKYEGDISKLVWAWLQQAKKFYIKDHKAKGEN